MKTCSVDGCNRPYRQRGFCHNHHQKLWRKGLIQAKPAKSLRDRLDDGVEKIPECGCWVWTKSTNNRGYGVISVGGKQQYAHRVSYVEYKGVIAGDLEVCHKCDTPGCINPDHLFLGSHRENMADSINKGRGRFVLFNGRANCNAIFSDAQLEEIRSRKKTAEALAKEYGCRPETICRVRKGHTYKTNNAELRLVK